MSKAGVAIIGAGTMGSGIAQVAANHGHDVFLRELDPMVAQRAVNGIGQRLGQLVEKGKMSPDDVGRIMGRLHVAYKPQDLAACSLVIEAIVEDLATKVTVLSAIRPHVRPDTVIASNTSSLSITRIGQGIGVPEQTVGMHFFNPAPLMPLVEIISNPKTRPEVADFAEATALSWGKTVVRAKDTPGFIVNRVARGYYLEALRMLGEGVATVEEIDATLKQVGAFRMGPFELMDLVGIDVNYAVSRSVWEQFNEPARLRPHPIQAELVKAGHLGRKTGRGAYDYSTNPPKAAIQVSKNSHNWGGSLSQAIRAFASAIGHADLPMERAYVAARTLAAIMNEAAWALSEQVASAEHIDIAMKTGTNYPLGPLEWAAKAGYATVGNLLRELNKTTKDCRFAEAPMFAA